MIIYTWSQKQQQIEININNIGNQTGFDTYDVYVYIDGDNERTDDDNYVYQIDGGDISANNMKTFLNYAGGDAASQSDYIVTGRNQDLVVGGNGNDAIDSGKGHDVVIGDNAKVEMVDYNPIGVREPLMLKLLDLTSPLDNYYLGKSGTTGQVKIILIGNQTLFLLLMVVAQQFPAFNYHGLFPV